MMNSNPATQVPPEVPMGTSTGPAKPAKAPASPVRSNTEADRLEKVLPQIKDLAEKVGGYQKLMDLIRQLDRGE